MRPLYIAAISTAFLLGCNQSDAASADHHATGETATHDQDGVNGRIFAAENDLGGYYMPASDIALGDIYLDHIAIGLDWEFEAFMAGEPDAYPPLTLHFEDRSSPTGVGELGNTYYEVTYWFEPGNFLVTDSALAFSGTHEELGEIRFEGTFDAEQVAAMQNGDPHLAETALTGTMHIGDAVFEDVNFQGWLGD